MIVKFGQQAHLNDSRQRNFKEKKKNFASHFQQEIMKSCNNTNHAICRDYIWGKV